MIFDYQKTVGVFRMQMFKPSEPFITAQASQLADFKPIFLGRNNYGYGSAGIKQIALEDVSAPRSIPIIWNAVTRDPTCFLRLLGANQVSLIHAHFGPDAVYALPLARRLGIPLVTTFHGFDASVSDANLIKSGSPYLINYVLFRRQLARQGSLFLCISNHIEGRVLDLGFPPEKTKCHYIGVDVAAIQPTDELTGTKTILHVARLVEKKGTQYLIKAFALLRPKHSDIELTIIGDGPLLPSLKTLVASCGMNGIVKFMSAQPHGFVLESLKKSAFLVLPSVTARSGDVEGLGLVLLEAAATGIPVIGTRNGGIPEAVIDGETGILVPERDVAALTAAMDRLLSNEAERRSMGAAARALVVRKFNIRTQTALLEQYYLDLLN
jgi:glycosyltransferase involved in cell wall biosynthesis